MAIMLWIEVEVAAGSPIDEAARATIELSRRLGVGVIFTLNGIVCNVGSNATVEAIAAHYEEESRRPDSVWRHDDEIDDRLTAIERRLDAADSYAQEQRERG